MIKAPAAPGGGKCGLEARWTSQSGGADPDIQPPFEVIEPPRLAAPLVFDSPHSGSRYPARVPRRLAARPADSAPLRGRLRRRIVSALRRARRAPAAGALSARVSRPQSRAVRARPADVRRAAARLRQHPLAAGRRRARDDPARRRRRPADLRSRVPVADALARIAALHRPYHQRLAGLIERTRARFGVAILIDCHSMPSTLAEAGGLDIVLGDRFGASAAPVGGRSARIGAAGARAIASAATSPTRGATSPSTTARPPPAATPCRSRSTAPFTWTSARMVKHGARGGAGRDLFEGGRGGAGGARSGRTGERTLGGGVRAIGAGRHAQTA